MEIAGIYDVIVVGGGPAGSTAAVTAAQLGASVLLLERGSYPRHKVCGEFVSPEAVGMLSKLLHFQGADNVFAGAPELHSARLHAAGRCSELPLRPPGISISRRALDHALWRAAAHCGTTCRERITVTHIERDGARFAVQTSERLYTASRVINASGRWSQFNSKLPPDSPRWLGIKAHVAGQSTGASVDLYFFREGYCGVQPVTEGVLNVCSLLRPGKIRSFEQVLRSHGELERISRDWQPASEILTTFPIAFRPANPVSNGVLNAGDAAAFIDPFVGDGISMALHTGCLAGQLAAASTDLDRAVLDYRTAYLARFSAAHRMAALARAALSSRLRNVALAAMGVPLLSRFMFAATRAKAQL